MAGELAGEMAGENGWRKWAGEMLAFTVVHSSRIRDEPSGF